MNNFAKNLAMAAFVLATACVTVQAQSFPIAAEGTEGLRVQVAETGRVFATFLGHSAAYTNQVVLNDTVLFTNWESPVGEAIDLGEFAAGTILDFRMHVVSTEETFYMGAASRNVDEAFHARAQADWAPGTTLISFEDLSYGPYDYNDLSFSVSNTFTTSVPEPGVAILGLVGVMAIFAQRRFKRAAQQA